MLRFDHVRHAIIRGDAPPENLRISKKQYSLSANRARSSARPIPKPHRVDTVLEVEVSRPMSNLPVWTHFPSKLGIDREHAGRHHLVTRMRSKDPHHPFGHYESDSCASQH